MKSLRTGTRKGVKFPLRKWAGMLVMAGMVLNAADALSSSAAKPCGTNGPFAVSSIAKYSYTRNAVGETTARFQLNSPPIQITDTCDVHVPYVYGNGGCGDFIGVDITETDISREDNALIDKATRDSLIESLSFHPYSFPLDNPGADSRQIDMTFSNTDVAAGTYNITVEIKGPEGCAVDPAHIDYEVTVTDPSDVDTEAPSVRLTSPSADKVCLNGMVPAAITAVDPPQNRAGTGIGAVRTFIESRRGVINEDISTMLTADPILPVAAGNAVTVSTDHQMTVVGTYTVIAEADDMAGHTGTDFSEPFTVSVNVAALPPMGVVGRKFKVGSTIPIKWTITDCEGNPLPPYASVNIDVLYNDSAESSEIRVAGAGADSIRWQLDEFGNALHYVTDFTIPKAGTYGVKVYVTDVDGEDVQQGEDLIFTAAYKGNTK